MAPLRGDFSGLGTLVGMVGHIPSRLAKSLFEHLHLLKGCVLVAVYAGDEHSGLVHVGGIVEDGSQVRIDSFIWVLGVVHHTGETVPDGAIS